MSTEQTEEIIWEVKQVLDKKINPVTGEVEYLLQWKNWQGSPTWEPEDNCDCTLLIKKFEKELKNRESSNQSQTPNHQSIPKARGSRSTGKRRANVLCSSSSSSGTRAASQPPGCSSEFDGLQTHYQSSTQTNRRRSDRVRDVVQRNVIDLTADTADDSYDSEPVKDVTPRNSTNKWQVRRSSKGPRSQSPPPQQSCDSSCSDLDEDKIKERKLRLKEIVGAQKGEELHLIVKWHGIPNLEKVPLKVLRKLYCQEILDFLIRKIKWTN